MTEGIIPPAPFTPLITAATVAPDKLINQTIPRILPVDMISLPPDFPVANTPATLSGIVQPLPDQSFSLVTAQGTLMLKLPTLANHPALQTVLQNSLSDATAPFTVTLQLSANASGELVAKLQLPPALLLAAHKTIPPNTALPIMSDSLIGKTIAAVQLPVASNSNPTVAQAANTLPLALPANKPAELNSISSLLSLNKAGSTEATSPPLLQVRLEKIIPAGQNLPSLQQNENIATVLQTGNKQLPPIIQIGETQLLLKTTIPLPAGSSVIVTLVPTSTPNNAIMPIIPDSTLAQAKELLLAEPSLQPLLQQKLPQMNAALAGALLLLLHAIPQGQKAAGVWLGKTALSDLEPHKKEALIKTLNHDLADAIKTTHDEVVGEWQHYQLPWLEAQVHSDQPQPLPLQTMHIYIHQHDAQRRDDSHQYQREVAATAASHKQTRFVIDITFTKLGTMQLDGFIQKQQFDLALRSKQHLSNSLQDELSAAFQHALAATGYQGQLFFQTEQRNWLHLENKASVKQQV